MYVIVASYFYAVLIDDSFGRNAAVVNDGTFVGEVHPLRVSRRPIYAVEFSDSQAPSGSRGYHALTVPIRALTALCLQYGTSIAKPGPEEFSGLFQTY